MKRSCSLLVATDLDGTLLGPGEAFTGEARTFLQKLVSLGALVVPVTAKSVWEIVVVWREVLGLAGEPLIAIAESGGAIYAPPGTLRSPTGYESELNLEYVEIGARLGEVEDAIDYVASACQGFRRLSKAGPLEASKITGLPPRRAAIAAKRRYLEVLWHPDQKCMEAAEARALELRLYTHRSTRLLHVGAHGGKRRALERLLIEPWARDCKLLVAIGDMDADEEMLEIADIAVHVPSNPEKRPARPVYRIPSPLPAPHAIAWIVERILEPRLPL